MLHIKRNCLILILFLLFSKNNALIVENGGARNISMGNTGIASSNDNSSAVYNPALLYRIKNIQLTSNYTKFFWKLYNDNLSNGFFAISMPFRKIGSFSVTSNFFNSTDFNKTRFGIHYGKNFFNKFSLGLSFFDYNYSFEKNIYTYNDPLFINNGFSKNFINFDLSAYSSLSNNIGIGIIYKNILKTDISLASNKSDFLPNILGIGFNYNISKFDIAVDFEHTFENVSNISSNIGKLGFEYLMNKNLALRCGVNNNSLTGGFGIRIFHKLKTEIIHDPLTSDEIVNTTLINFTLDYAFQYPINSIVSNFGDHFFGIKIDYSNASSPKERYRDLVPPKIQKVYYKRTFIDSFKNQNVNTDTFLIKQKIKIDTVYIEKIKLDTIRIYSGVPDTLYRKKIAELEKTKLKLENVKRINKALIHLSNAMKYYYLNNYSQALSECKKAIVLAPDLALGYIRIGSIYYKIGDFKKAKKYWKKAKLIDPNNPEIKVIPKNFLNSN